eukprot:scpid101856/ scgid26729/ 
MASAGCVSLAASTSHMSHIALGKFSWQLSQNSGTTLMPAKSNPGNLGSRGPSVTSVITNELCWEGSTCLQQEQCHRHQCDHRVDENDISLSLPQFTHTF